MSVMMVFNAVILVIGIYMIVSALQMKKSGKISQMLLAKEELKKVKDENGFITFLYRREILLGVVMIIVGILGFFEEKVSLPGAFRMVEVVIFLAAFLWFQNSLMKARQKFLRQI